MLCSSRKIKKVSDSSASTVSDTETDHITADYGSIVSHNNKFVNILRQIRSDFMITLEQIRCPNPQCNRRLVDLSGKAEIICPKCKSLIFVDTDERKIYRKPKSVKK